MARPKVHATDARAGRSKVRGFVAVVDRALQVPETERGALRSQATGWAELTSQALLSGAETLDAEQLRALGRIAWALRMSVGNSKMRGDLAAVAQEWWERFENDDDPMQHQRVAKSSRRSPYGDVGQALEAMARRHLHGPSGQRRKAIDFDLLAAALARVLTDQGFLSQADALRSIPHIQEALERGASYRKKELTEEKAAVWTLEAVGVKPDVANRIVSGARRKAASTKR